MASRGRTSALVSEGALFEAVARGNKDTFFFRSDEFALEDPLVVSPFETRFKPTAPFVQELRRIPPLNGADFGRVAEFELETAGDLFTDITVLIDLPTWLPPAAVAALRGGGTVTHGPSGYTAGYTAAIGYFLFEKIQLYQDKVLLYEFSGDALWASRLSRNSITQSYVIKELTGDHNHTAAEVARNGAPPRLRLRLPFPGTETAPFPSIAMRAQVFRLRLHLRKLEALVETSDAQEQPQPWLAPTLTVTPAGPDATPLTLAPIPRLQIGPPTLQLEARHLYTDQESRDELCRVNHEIPFQVLYENKFTFGPLDYAPLEKGGVALSTQRLDAQHPAGRIFWVFRSQNDLRAGRRWRITPPDISGVQQTYYTSVALVIAGRDREAAADRTLWETVVPHAKEEKDGGGGFGSMNWTLGDVAGRRAGDVAPVPEGTVNFTTADRPTLLISLSGAVAPDTRLGKPSTEMLAIVQSWALYAVENNRGFLKYAN